MKNFGVTENWFYLYSLLFLIFFINSPMLALLFTILFFSKSIELNYKKMRFWGVVVCSAISFLNLLKIPESDAISYINYIDYLSGLKLNALFDISYKSIKTVEFIFNIYSWVIAQVDSTGLLFNYISVFVIYYLLFLTSINMMERIGIRGSFIALIMLTLFFGLTLSLSGHLIRNYLAMAVLVYIVSLSVSDSFVFNYRYFILLTVPGFIHVSLLVFPILITFICYFQSRFKNIVLVFFLSLSIGFISSLMISVLLELVNGGVSEFDSKIPVLMIVFDSFQCFLFIALIRKNAHLERAINVFTSLICSLVFILALTSSTNLIFYRYYFVFDFLRGIIALILVSRYLNLNSLIGFVVNMLIVVFSILFFCVRVSSSGWDYGSDSLFVLFETPLLGMLERIILIWGL